MVEQSEEEFLEEIYRETRNGSLSKEQVSEMADKHGIRLYQAENIWSFYGKEEKNLKICNGLPCKLSSGSSMNEFIGKYPENDREVVSCLGYCEHAPVAMAEGKYFHLSSDGASEIAVSPEEERKVTSLAEYVDAGGFETLRRTVDEDTTQNIRALAREFSLKGFGGSGFPTWVKWDAVADSRNGDKYLVVNAHEGEPGTFKDRVILENRPFELIEASLIAAHAVGASKIIIALKFEYRNAEKALKKALGASISYFGEKLSGRMLPKIKISRIPGYYITGEESALLEAMEGKRSEPRLRPPFPAEVGLHGKPTLIDNVETLVYFLGLLKEHYGDGKNSKRDKAYCLTGDVPRPGAYFLPYGTESKVLLTEKGGADMSKLKAVFPGGLSGGILPADRANVALDFDSVRKAGAGMGTGATIAISSGRCMVDVMENVSEFFERESCGKCMPCRLGTGEMSRLFSRLKSGDGTSGDIEAALKTADVMMKGSICGLGQAAARMFMDSIRYYGDEITQHASGICQANVCFPEVKR